MDISSLEGLVSSYFSPRAPETGGLGGAQAPSNINQEGSAPSRLNIQAFVQKNKIGKNITSNLYISSRTITHRSVGCTATSSSAMFKATPSKIFLGFKKNNYFPKNCILLLFFEIKSFAINLRSRLVVLSLWVCKSTK